MIEDGGPYRPLEAFRWKVVPEASAACLLRNGMKNRAGKSTPAYAAPLTSRGGGVRDNNKCARDSAWARDPPGDKVDKSATSRCLTDGCPDAFCRSESC